MSVIRRSELTVVPAFSGHCAAGRTTCASAVVSVGWYGVLGDHQLGAAQRLAGPRGVRHRDRRVGAEDPDGLHAAVLERLEQVGGGQAGLRGDRPGGQAPVRLDLGAVIVAHDLAVARQQVREPAGLAPAHRVRLAGQRQRPGARPADLAR